jgi:sigma-B regulation protein RsbU (phosphoserine phosphatase)
MGRLRKFEVAVFRLVRRDQPEGFVHRGAFWLFVGYLALSLPGWIPGTFGKFFSDLAALDFFLLLILCVPLLWRFIFLRLLWKVRNRLIVTYLLMGLTPVVLFVTLALILLYVFSGQFAIFAATSVVHDELEHIGSMNSTLAMHIAHMLSQNPRQRAVALPEEGDQPAEHEYSGLSIAAYQDGKPIALEFGSVQPSAPPPVPLWLKDSFRGIVVDHAQLWLRAADVQKIGDHTTVVISSVPIQQENVEAIAKNLGRVTIYPGVSFGELPPAPQAPPKGRFEFNAGRPNNGQGQIEINAAASASLL